MKNKSMATRINEGYPFKVKERQEPTEEHISLYYKEGSSDKVYLVRLEPILPTTGWIVSFNFGRRGNALSVGTKTKEPVDYATAKKIYDKLIHEKTCKGYQVEGGDPMAMMTAASTLRDTGIRLQLLNPVDADALESLFKDPAYCMQEKFDGRRRGLIKEGDEVTGTNRRGQSTAAAEAIAADMRKIDEDITLDTEDMGSYARVFDILHQVPGAGDITKLPYVERLAKLSNLFLTYKFNSLKLVMTAINENGKRDLYAKVKKANGEGVVFKRLDATYTAGRPASGGTQLKFKFKATGSFIVAGVTKGKRSIDLTLADGTDIGKVTVPCNQEIPAVGNIVEVEYLYAYKGGSLFQPVLLCVRDDIFTRDCTAKQLKYKPDTEEDA